MQEYMISRREALYGEMPQPEEVPDQAAKNYRAMMMQKKEQSYKGKTGILSYLISILTVIALCTVSVILLGSIKRMDNMEQTISVMSIAMESTEEEGDTGKNSIAIETIGGRAVRKSCRTNQAGAGNCGGGPADTGSGRAAKSGYIAGFG